MDSSMELLFRLYEENVKFKVAYSILRNKMERARKEDANFLLDEDDITEVLEIAGVIDLMEEVRLDS
ncbi:MAG: hypothetical protein J6Y78_08535 [Paludibacteraceae bacterium]|nr:hypothetical protein [Paludibacteraceae bacterium]